MNKRQLKKGAKSLTAAIEASIASAMSRQSTKTPYSDKVPKWFNVGFSSTGVVAVSTDGKTILHCSDGVAWGEDK